MTCITCKTDKPAEAFAKDQRYGRTPGYPKSGESRIDETGIRRHDQCRSCKSAYDKKRWNAMPSEKKAKHNDWPNKGRAAKLKKAYGITLAEYDQQLAKQGGGCAICSRPPKSRSLDVDHDHKSGQLRGLLCHMCNRALAYLRNDNGAARRAGEYLLNPPWQP